MDRSELNIKIAEVEQRMIDAGLLRSEDQAIALTNDAFIALLIMVQMIERNTGFLLSPLARTSLALVADMATDLANIGLSITAEEIEQTGTEFMNLVRRMMAAPNN